MQEGIVRVPILRPNKTSTPADTGTGGVQGNRSKSTTIGQRDTRIVGPGNTAVSVLRSQNVAGHFPDRIFMRRLMLQANCFRYRIIEDVQRGKVLWRSIMDTIKFAVNRIGPESLTKSRSDTDG